MCDTEVELIIGKFIPDSDLCVPIHTPGGVPGVLYEPIVPVNPMAITNNEHCMVDFLVFFAGVFVIITEYTLRKETYLYSIGCNCDSNRLLLNTGLQRGCVVFSRLNLVFDFNVGGLRGLVLAVVGF